MLLLIGFQAFCAGLCVLLGEPLYGIVCVLSAILTVNLLTLDRLYEVLYHIDLSLNYPNRKKDD